jgi:hypothetical protein
MTSETDPAAPAKGEFDHVIAAAKHARAKHSNADGSPLTEAQHAAILHAQVKAIIDGFFEPPHETPLPEVTEATATEGGEKAT